MPYKNFPTDPCAIKGCPKTRRAGGMCWKHYMRKHRGAVDPRFTAVTGVEESPTAAPAHIRFWRYVKKTRGCWIWTGGRQTTPKGFDYGVFHPDDGKGGASRRVVRAHRWIYEHLHGVLPLKKMVLHKCDNPPCVNPKHLYEGGDTANHHDMMVRKRYSKKMVKLDAGKVRRMRRLLTTSERSYTDIGREFGVHRTTVQRIAIRQRWRHVP